MASRDLRLPASLVAAAAAAVATGVWLAPWKRRARHDAKSKCDQTNRPASDAHKDDDRAPQHTRNEHADGIHRLFMSVPDEVSIEPGQSVPDEVSIEPGHPVSIKPSHPSWTVAQEGDVTTLVDLEPFPCADGAAPFAPFSIALDGDGNILVAEGDCILKVTPAGSVTVLAGSRGYPGFGDGPAAIARFDGVWGIAVNCDGSLVVSETANHCIRSVGLDGTVQTLAGSGYPDFLDGQAMEACFQGPRGIAINGDGNVIVADTCNHCIRRISSDGIVSTVAGSGVQGFRDGPASFARFNGPSDVKMDSNGNIVVADRGNNCIRKITYEGDVSTVAGGTYEGFVNGVGAQASFCCPTNIALDGDCNIVVADCHNDCIRKVGTAGVVVTLAGRGCTDESTASFDEPRGIAVDSDGNVIVADSGNGRIQKVFAGLTPWQQTMMSNAAPLRSSSFVEDLRQMMTEPALADVTFIVGSAEIMAHRNILAARSHYFAAMLMSNFFEGAPGARVPLPDATVPAFRTVLTYLYTDAFVVDDEAILDVLHLAKQYDITRLYQLGTRHCMRKLDTENAIDWLVRADMYGLVDLRAAALAYVTKNFGVIRTAMPATMEQLTCRPGLMLELMMQIPVM